MTFQVCNLSSKKPYFNKAYVVRVYKSNFGTVRYKKRTLARESKSEVNKGNRTKSSCLLNVSTLQVFICVIYILDFVCVHNMTVITSK